MDAFKRLRGAYPTTKQKRKLISFVAQHPQLIKGKVSQDFTRRDSQNLWITIASECNSLPGARKSWEQWKKTWQDFRANVKRKQLIRNGEYPTSIDKLTIAEKEALGLKNGTSTNTIQNTVEFVAAEDESTDDEFPESKNESTQDEYLESKNESTQDELLQPEHESTQDNLLNGFNDSASGSEPELPPVKLQELSHSNLSAKKIKSKFMRRSDKSRDIVMHSDNKCAFNCDRLAIQEERKVAIKKDYLDFKKDYLRQKLLFMKEQTEALKNIAKELSK